MMRRSGLASRGVAALISLTLLLALVAGCRRSRSTGAAPSASTDPALPGLVAPSWLVTLEVPGHAPAKLAVPLGAKSPRPLLIALHGDDDRPEWTCGSYRHVAPKAFVLCPSGIARAERFTLGDTQATRAELRALLPALKARFGPHLAKGSVVLAGIGPSVTQAVQIALEEPAFFSRLALIDGPLDELSLGMVQRFATGGGKGVLAVCTPSSRCRPGASERQRAFEHAGVEARMLTPDRGQGLDGDVTAMLAREWPAFVREEPRWQ